MLTLLLVLVVGSVLVVLYHIVPILTSVVSLVAIGWGLCSALDKYNDNE